MQCNAVQTCMDHMNLSFKHRLCSEIVWRKWTVIHLQSVLHSSHSGGTSLPSFLTSSPKFTHCLRFPLPCLPRTGRGADGGGAHAPCRMKSRRRPGGQGRRRLGSRVRCGIRTQRQSPMHLRVGAWDHQGPKGASPKMELPMEDLLRPGDCPRHTPIAGGGGSCGSSHCSRGAAGEKLGF